STATVLRYSMPDWRGEAEGRPTQPTSGPLVAQSGYRQSASWRLRWLRHVPVERRSRVKISAYASLQRCRLGDRRTPLVRGVRGATAGPEPVMRQGHAERLE